MHLMLLQVSGAAGRCDAGVSSCRALPMESSIPIAQQPRGTAASSAVSCQYLHCYNFVLALLLCDLGCRRAVRNC